MINLKTFIAKSNFIELTEIEKVLYIGFYLIKCGEKAFTINQIDEILKNNGFHISNLSRIKTQVRKNKSFKNIGQNNYVITAAVQKDLSSKIDYIKNDNILETENELLEIKIFCGYAKYLDILVLQANKCYEENCFDASATMLRRLLEILLIKSYEALKIESQIKGSDGNYWLLEKICNDAKLNSTLNLSRIKNKLDVFRNLGNYAAHRITYNTTKKDIDDIKMDFRVLLEELLYKANFVK